ncbi:MAG: hypothetical protein JRD89_01095 [Deltaproteobacteria bacterium]|nr:hypothetical protein [Deltaproteobacteria bacterium]
MNLCRNAALKGGWVPLLFITLVLIMTPHAYPALPDDLPQDFYFELSEGNIEGHTRIHNFGHNPSVGTTWEDMWDNGTAYPFLSSATKFNVSSTDADDDASPPGTGAWNVTIYGLDANYLEINETVDLDGQNPVTTVNEYIRVYRVIVVSAGSTGTNEGHIFVGTGPVTAGVPSNVYAEVIAGHGQTLMAIYTVPANKTAFLTMLYMTSDEDKRITFGLFLRPPGGAWNIKDYVHLYRQTFNLQYLPPRMIPQKTDIVMRALASTAPAAVSGGFDLILVDNDKIGLSSPSPSDPTPIFAVVIASLGAALLMTMFGRR